jgi:hypothetical protein
MIDDGFTAATIAGGSASKQNACPIKFEGALL